MTTIVTEKERFHRCAHIGKIGLLMGSKYQKRNLDFINYLLRFY